MNVVLLLLVVVTVVEEVTFANVVSVLERVVLLLVVEGEVFIVDGFPSDGKSESSSSEFESSSSEFVSYAKSLAGSSAVYRFLDISIIYICNSILKKQSNGNC